MSRRAPGHAWTSEVSAIPTLSKKKKARLFGPGALIMLAFVAIVAVGLPHSPEHSKAISTAPKQKLWKPEPNLLLARQDLALSIAQRKHIQDIQAKWSADKAKLLQAMSAYTVDQGRSDQIQANLGGYSELSRTYDATRTFYWHSACALLSAQQQKLAEQPK